MAPTSAAGASFLSYLPTTVASRAHTGDFRVSVEGSGTWVTTSCGPADVAGCPQRTGFLPGCDAALRRNPGLLGEVGQIGQAWQQVGLPHERAEGQPDGDVVIGAAYHVDPVAGADLALGQDPQIGS